MQGQSYVQTAELWFQDVPVEDTIRINQGRPNSEKTMQEEMFRAGNVGGQNRGGIINPGQAKPIKIQTTSRTRCTKYNPEECAVLMKNNRCFLQEKQFTNFEMMNVDDSPECFGTQYEQILEADQCDAFDSDVDETPNVQTMFMVNLSSEDPIYDEAGPSHDSNTPFEVQDHDTFVDHMDEYHEVHEMQNDVQHNYVVDSNAEYTSDSNIILYNQYLEENEENGVQNTDKAKTTRKWLIPGKHEHKERKSIKEAGNSKPKSLASSNAPHWSSLTRKATLEEGKHKGMLGFALEVLSQEAQRPLTHGCHASNPCVPNLIQRLKSKDSMIRRIEGYDQEECLTNFRARIFFEEL
ncbi:hypothetical protein Tco_0646847 [Tanacetum coccineum]